MTNNEIVLDAFTSLEGNDNHNTALIAAICSRNTIGEALAAELVAQAIKDGLLRVDALGDVWRA